MCADSYSVSVPPPCYRSGTQKTPVILLIVHVAGYTKTRMHQRSRSGRTVPLSRHCVGKCQDNELTRNSSGNTRPQSSHLAEPLLTDPGLKSGISACELIYTLDDKAQAGNDSLNLPPKPLHGSNNANNINNYFCAGASFTDICIY